MAILQSIDGRFYQVPDDEADKFLVPADKVEETLRAAGAAQPQQTTPAAPIAGGIPLNAGPGPVIIYVGGGGMPMAPGAQPMGAPAEQVQAYAHHHHGHHHHGHHGHHGGWGGWWGGWGGGWGGCYNNYYNYRNYYNYWCW
jgi:hypothetical protein